MNASSSQIIPATPRDKVITFAVLAMILLVAALSTSIASYRAKRVQSDRTDQLRSYYQSLGGDLSTPFLSGNKLGSLSEKDQTFVSIYELNQLSRAYGIKVALTKISPENKGKIESAENNLEVKDIFSLDDQKTSDAHTNRNVKLVETALSNFINGVAR